MTRWRNPRLAARKGATDRACMINPMKPGRVPLERALSKLGLATRTEARRLIGDGRVSVHGRTVDDPLMPVVPERAHITIDGASAGLTPPVMILLHKPRGTVTTRRDPDGRKTVYDCLTGLEDHVIPVGRLDAASSGLLLLTNDTRLADWLTDPVHAIPRTYLVTVRGRLTEEDARLMEAGLTDRGETLRAVRAEILKASGRETHLRVVLDEGRNREIRRLGDGVGHEVTRLKRIAVGGLELGDLPAGDWLRLDDAMLRGAFPGAPIRRGQT